MSKPILTLVVEKRPTARKMAEVVSRRWPDHQICFVYTLYVGPFRFSYPRGLTMGDYPFVGEPFWTPRDEPYWSVDTVVEHDRLTPAVMGVAAALRDAETIIFAGDPDGSSAVAYHTMLTELLGTDVAAQPRPAVKLWALDPATLERNFASLASTSDAWFQRILAEGQARRYFDFNYNTNALAIHGAALRATGPVPPGFLLSKYALQLLYWLQDTVCNAPMVLVLMAEHKMGSPASRSAILGQLHSAGLLEDVRGRDAIALSERGRLLLAALHPDSRDPHFGERYARWQATWPASKPAMDRYIRTFFGKQKRCARTHWLATQD